MTYIQTKPLVDGGGMGGRDVRDEDDDEAEAIHSYPLHTAIS